MSHTVDRWGVKAFRLMAPLAALVSLTVVVSARPAFTVTKRPRRIESDSEVISKVPLAARMK